mmetsp:Transcript_23361/g.41329  ORF Transcript_23361/g.41329 Transcript_23361/m.41329 type:complete len:248 (+) Transcript_23361:208-951(+)
MELSRDMIVGMVSGECLMESVFSLSLENKGIALSSVVDECFNLKKLNLANNQLQTLAIGRTKLEPKEHLKYFDLSHNRLKNLDTFPICERLQILHLEGNLIDSIDDILVLKDLAPNLKQLFLQSVSGSDANPVCARSGYGRQIAQMLPDLQVLDGMRLRYQFSLFSVEQSLGLDQIPTKEQPKHDTQHHTQHDTQHDTHEHTNKDSHANEGSRSPQQVVSKDAIERFESDIGSLEAVLESCIKAVNS